MTSVKRSLGRLVVAAGCLGWPAQGWAAGVLSVEIVNGYNLVVDSNVTAPPTYAPKSAYIGGRVCNTGDAPLADVSAQVGNYNGGVGSTPGVFPSRTFVSPDPQTQLYGTGSYALKIEADATGIADGTRYIGTLNPGECRIQYWLFSYPQCVNVGGAPQSPPCDVSITGGVKPIDDPSLFYDVWATTTTPSVPAVSKRRSFTMRNEISASANKIWPNNAAKVPPEYLAAIQSVVGWGTLGPDGQPITPTTGVYPGQRLITTQGIWYDLGNVGQGFDNDGDLIPDQNAWLQPVGDPGAFDADCFRMINLYGIVIVKLKGGGELLIPFQNQLYFEHLPDNTGVVGLVYYQFVATDGICTANMTPYQEAASGFDNEKFSADYGLSLPLRSRTFGPDLTLAKTDGVTSTSVGSTLTYTVSIPTNTTGVNLGAPDLGVPLVFRETIPAGTTYVAGSAVAGLNPPSGTGSYQQGYTDVDGNLDTCTINYSITSSSFRVFYSTNGGATWSLTEPVPASSVTDVRWMLLTSIALDGRHDGRACVAPDGTPDASLSTSLPAGKLASVTFRVLVGSSAGPVLCNIARLGVGEANSSTQAQDCDVVTGNNTLSGTVFRDNGAGGGIYGDGTQQGGETGIGSGVIVTLYYDRNGDGKLDSGDLTYATTTTAANGTYSFSAVADGSYLVVAKKYDGATSNGVDDAATDAGFATTGWGNTTFDPNQPLTTAQGILKLNEDLLNVSLAVNIDLPRTNPAAQSVTGVNFGFAPPFRLTKTVTNNADANGDGVADTVIDEGRLFSYTLLLENRLPSVGRQGPTGCQYTVWATTGATGAVPPNKNFTNAVNAYDATSPNMTVASALVQGGGNRWLFGNSFNIAPQPGNITKVEGLYFGYYSAPLTDDQLNVDVGRSPVTVGNDGIRGSANTTAGLFSTAQIDSYIGAPVGSDPDSAISWDITSLRPGGGAWQWSEFGGVYLQVSPTKTANADFKTFFLDAVGLRVTTDKACQAGSSTTLDPVPLQDTYDTARVAFVSANPPPTSVNVGTGVIRWDNVGAITPGSSRIVTVSMRARNTAGLAVGSCTSAPGTITNTGCNYAETAYAGKRVAYADGRLANDDTSKIAVSLQGRAELRGIVWNDNAAPTGWPKGGAEPGLPNVNVTLYACVRADGVTLEPTASNKTCAAQTSGNFWKRWDTTVTDANGAYEFIGLNQGNYLVEVGDTDGAPATGNVAPYGGTQTAEANDAQDVTGLNANGHTCASCDNTWGNPGSNLNAMNQLVGEEIINGINFGYNNVKASLYGNIWHDVAGDTFRDAGDLGLAGFTVQRYTDPNGDGDPADGVLQASTLSDANGNYSFTNITPASYVIVVLPPKLRSLVWVETVESTGGTSSLNNQIPVTLISGQVSGSHDFGYTKKSTSSIGDTLYLDVNGNGYQDLAANGTPLEAGIADITVWLYKDVDRDGTVDAGVDDLVGTTSTDASGKYLFQNLAAGSYVVRVDTSDPQFPTAAVASGDPDVNTGRIGDFVWLDSNGDGVQNAGEDGLANVVVDLYADADGNGVKGPADPLVASTVTNVLGRYLFTGLGAGRYFVDVDESTLPSAALVLTTPDPVGTLVTLATNNSAVLTADAGYSPPGANLALGNRVWSDANGNGVQDSGEVGMPGVQVTVSTTTAGDPCFTPGCTVTTDASGFWLVTGLTQTRTYTATVVTSTLPRFFLPSTPAGAPSNSRTVTLTAAADVLSVDFGYRYNTDGNLSTRDLGDPTGSLNGRIFLDLNGNGTYDVGEARSGATVNLFDVANNVIASTTTAADGTYAFTSAANTGVFVGQYSIQSVDPLGTRYTVLFVSAAAAFPNLNLVYSQPVETVADGTSAVAVDGVHADLLQDFGFRRYQGSIGDTVYLDGNENASQDPGEPGIAGVTVNLYACGWTDSNANGVFESGEQTGCPTPLRTTTTRADDPLTPADESGKYLFSNLDPLPAGQFYLVQVVTATIPGGTPTLIADPDTDGFPCTLLPAPGHPPASVCDSLQLLSSGFTGATNYLGADFGYRLTGSGNGLFGDHLWVDTNGNGLLDTGELGIPAVTVWIDANNNSVLDWTDANGNGRWDAGEGERWVESDSDGYYLFTGLADGTYNVRVLTSDPDWPAGLPTTPTFEVRAGNTASLNSNVQVVISGGAVTSLVDGDPGTPDPCSGCALDVDFGYRYAGNNLLSGTICIDDTTGIGYCGATATTYSGVAAGLESPLSGIQVFLYRWTDDGDNVAWDAGTGALDPGDTFTALGAAVTQSNGDYSFANVPDNVVVVLSVSPTQSLRLTTTNANTSVEDGGVISRQLYDGTTTYAGQTVTATVRQALNLAGDADDNVLDLDFGFDATLGGTLLYDFGDLPDPPSGTPDYKATLLTSGGARHRIGAIRLGASNTAENDGYDSPNADADAGDDGVVSELTCGPNGGGVRVDVAGAPTGWLAGWIDFNDDGDFADPGELIVNQQVSAGTQIIVFDMPAAGSGCAVNQAFFSRFRLYPSQPLLVSSKGLALDQSFQPTTGEVEDYRWIVTVTPAIVSSFTARELNGAVALDWETASEVGTVGFFLRRLDPETGRFVEVDAAMLPSLVLTRQGGLYRYVDQQAQPGVDYTYELVEVAASGRHKTHGPFTVNTDSRASDEPAGDDPAALRWNALPDLDASGYAKVAHELHRAPSAPTPAVATGRRSVAQATRAKVGVGQSGIYFVGAADLAAQGGLSTGPANWAFSNRGLPVAFLPAADQSGAYFYGQQLDSPFARDNVYWVDGAARTGLRIGGRSEPAGPQPSGDETFVRSVHREEDRLPATSLFDDGDADYWIWDWVVAGQGPKAFTFRTDGLASGFESAALVISLRGGNDTPAETDHRVRVSVNGNTLGEIELRGTQGSETRLDFDSSRLVDGENTLQLEALTTDADYSLVLLDAFDVDYPSRYRAYANRLECGSAGHAALRITGFTRPDIMVFDVTDPRAPVYVQAVPTPDGDGSFGVTLFPPKPDRRYHAATPDAILAVTGIEPDSPSELRQAGNRGAYLVVTTAALKTAAQRLADYRAGLSSQVIDVVDVYDEFNAGIPSPHALRDFLAYARANWAEAPRYVVLAGDGSFDYKDFFAAGDNLVPTMMVGTLSGLAASDIWFGNVDLAGPAPEIAVGRLPAQDAAELDAMIDKIQMREDAAGSPWRERLLLLADNSDDGGDFLAGSERIAAAAAPVPAERIYLSALGLSEARSRLLSGINEGAGRINYLGHGGYDVLADEGLLRSSDVAALVNFDRPTVVTALTCLAGDFSAPGYPSLGELLVRQPAGGAAAVWSATGLSHNGLAVALGEHYYAVSARGDADRRLRIGDATLAAMRSFEAAGGTPWMLSIFELLGDPAMWLD